MTGIAIYIEGGGDTRGVQANLRIGFDGLLWKQKEAARRKLLRWKIVCEGGRDQAFASFRNAIRVSPADINVLLIDAEEPCTLGPTSKNELVEAGARIDHLRKRDPHWDFTGITGDRVHLMVRAMEAWIVADPAAMGRYYKQGFQAGQLASRLNLEEEPKASLFAGIANATRQTKTKGEYVKGRHAADLLPMLDPALIAARCPRFAVFSVWLDKTIAATP